MTMQSLIERLEAATGPDRELDAGIAAAVRAFPARWLRQFDDVRAVGVLVHAFNASGQSSANWRPDTYTYSIDAALTLVPKGCQWTIEADAAWVRWLTADDVDTAQAHFNHRGGSSTALALCIAALKARCLVPSPVGKGDA